MFLKSLLTTAAILLLAAPGFASPVTYYGGYEDLKSGDYDYNDVIFSLSGDGLKLHSSDGAFFSKPELNSNGKPFWDNPSFDGGNKNIGFCIYGGGDCGSGLNPGAQYLADAKNHQSSAQQVSFTTDGDVQATITLKISSKDDVLGYYNNSNRNDLHFINPNGATGTFTFSPGREFSLVGTDYLGHGAYGDKYLSLNDLHSKEPSHFAFFSACDSVTATPEPGTLGIAGGALALLGVLRRRMRGRIASLPVA